MYIIHFVWSYQGIVWTSLHEKDDLLPQYFTLKFIHQTDLQKFLGQFAIKKLGLLGWLSQCFGVALTNTWTLTLKSELLLINFKFLNFELEEIGFSCFECVFLGIFLWYNLLPEVGISSICCFGILWLLFTGCPSSQLYRLWSVLWRSEMLNVVMVSYRIHLYSWYFFLLLLIWSVADGL